MKTRREFLKAVPDVLLAAAGLTVLAKAAAKASGMGGTEASDTMGRMMADLKRAMAKPADQRRWAMGIDLRKCIGCEACTVACRAENKTGPGVSYRPVLVENTGTFPEVKRTLTPKPCMHCEKPACLAACPEGAIKKTPDGIVYVNYAACKGVRACIPACPYEVPNFDDGGYFTDGTPAVQAYEKAAAYEMGVKLVRDKDGKAPMGRMRKCTYCFHRLQSGTLPACTTTCIGHATFFGDLNDTNSLIFELSESSRMRRLKEAEGTRPTTFYLV